MMTHQRILGRLRLIMELPDDPQKFLPHCCAALEQLLPQVRPDANQNDPRLDFAAATIAYGMILWQKENPEVEFSSFRAGDVALSAQSGGTSRAIERARKLREDALQDARDLLRDEHFSVTSTRFLAKGGPTSCASSKPSSM